MTVLSIRFFLVVADRLSHHLMNYSGGMGSAVLTECSTRAPLHTCGATLFSPFPSSPTRNPDSRLKRQAFPLEFQIKQHLTFRRTLP